MWRTHRNCSPQNGAKFPEEMSRPAEEHTCRRRSETEFATEVLHRDRVALKECENEMDMTGDFES